MMEIRKGIYIHGAYHKTFLMTNKILFCAFFLKVFSIKIKFNYQIFSAIISYDLSPFMITCNKVRIRFKSAFINIQQYRLRVLKDNYCEEKYIIREVGCCNGYQQYPQTTTDFFYNNGHITNHKNKSFSRYHLPNHKIKSIALLVILTIAVNQ